MPVSALADGAGTPAYVYNAEVVRRQYQALDKAFAAGSRNDWNESLRLAQEALAAAKSRSDRSGEAAATFRIANALSGLGHIEKALDSYRQAVTIARENGNRQIEANIDSAMGDLYSGFFTRASSSDFAHHVAFAIKRCLRHGDLFLLNDGEYTQAHVKHAEHFVVGNVPALTGTSCF